MARSLGWYFPEQMILKATLIGSAPKIWRRVEVHSGLTLHDLHFVSQCVFDWDNAHLYDFLVPPGGKLTRRALTNATRYHVLPPAPVFGDDFEEEARRADEAMMGRVFTPQCRQIVYEYDFGDSWEHLIKIEKRTPGGDPSHVPQCLAGENAAPPEDCGGIGGYYHWLEALRAVHPAEREAAGEVHGTDFDPARFDLDAANRRLAATFVPAQKRPRKRKRK
jgi:hypothetical protein